MSIVKKIQYNVCLAVLASVMLFSSFLAVADESQKTPTVQQKPLIITTIKPLAIIAKSAVADNARVEYLQSAVQSAHEVSLPVSALKKIEQAELIVWIGEGFEARIGKPMALLSEAKRITVMELDLLPADHGDSEKEANKEAHKNHHHHEHLQFDPHVWLNPANANIVANSIQQRLNLPIFPIIDSAQIEQLKVELKPYKKKSYLTHHDAFAHFVTAFELAEGHSIRDASGASQGARSQYLLRQQASEAAASCIFIEPQYADKDAKVLARELQLPLKILDPQGFDQPLTDDSYGKFMTGLVAQFKACFE